MSELLLVVELAPGAVAAAGLGGRDEIEDPLDDALAAAGLGSVVGGGGGERGCNIDLEVQDERKVVDAVALIRQILVSLDVPRSTVVVQHEPSPAVYQVYE